MPFQSGGFEDKKLGKVVPYGVYDVTANAGFVGVGITTAIERGLVDLVINIPIEYDELSRPDGYHIRRRAVDADLPLVTTCSGRGPSSRRCATER